MSPGEGAALCQRTFTASAAPRYQLRTAPGNVVVIFNLAIFCKGVKSSNYEER